VPTEPAEAALTLSFKCDPAIIDRVPAPVPAREGLPEWVRSMPAEAFNAVLAGPEDTVKRCPPFLDAMTQGFLLPLLCDVEVQDGVLTWDFDIPAAEGDFARSPLSFHDPSQVIGTPFHDPDRFLLKFHNVWNIQAPPGYAVLFTHPVNRFDLPFTTLTGLVDSDRYSDAPVHFPAMWTRPDFRGVLKRGTPVAQCIPVKREAWGLTAAPFTDQDRRRSRALVAQLGRERGLYRRRYRTR
jgi:hypothetical protein